MNTRLTRRQPLHVAPGRRPPRLLSLCEPLTDERSAAEMDAVAEAEQFIADLPALVDARLVTPSLPPTARPATRSTTSGSTRPPKETDMPDHAPKLALHSAGAGSERSAGEQAFPSDEDRTVAGVPPAPSSRSRHIPVDQRVRLWVQAGGRCEICNKYLLEDPSTMEPLNLADLAHNVGHKASASSPRGEHPLPPDQRNLAENLLLVCGDDHRTIDDKVTRGVYTVEYLHELKRRHEDRIRYLAGLGEDAETVVLRVIGDIRGAPVELSEQRAARDVLNTWRRYPRFGWGYGGSDFEVDLRGLPAEGTPLFWQAGRERIQEQLGVRLRDAVARGQVRHLSVFCLARIPLLACVGEQLDDKVPVELFQKQRGGDEGWGWDERAAPVSFRSESVRGGSPARVAVLVALSAALSLSDLPDELAGAAVWTITPREQPPGRDILRARVSLDNFARAYHDCLGEIEAVRPKPSAIDLLPAVPAAAAVTLGRGLMRGAQPAVRIYDRQAPDAPFTFALEINA